MSLAWHSHTYDVVVVGSGLAGLSAALTVAEFGLNPVVFEKDAAPGGVTAVSEGCFNAADSRRQIPLGIEDSPEKHLRQALRMSGGRGREPLLRTLCYEAYAAQQWLETIGVHFEERVHRARGAFFPRSHKPVSGGGRAYIETLLRALDPFDVPVVTEANVTSIVRSKDRVRGVEVEQQGRRLFVPARCGVVLAGGSFIRNVDMMKLYAPGLAEAQPWMTSGTDGSLLLAAADAGAGLVGMSAFELSFTTSSFCLPNDPARFILVNREGRRFVREDLTQDALLKAVIRQPGGTAWLISHAQEKRDPPGDPVFDALMAKAAASFNESVMLERPDVFGKDRRLLQPIREPFCLSRLTPRLMTSYGGVEIDVKARVLDRYGRPIPGLTAAGDITGGLYGEHGLYGDLLAGAAVFGRIAARTLVWSGRERRTQRFSPNFESDFQKVSFISPND